MLIPLGLIALLMQVEELSLDVVTSLYGDIHSIWFSQMLPAQTHHATQTYVGLINYIRLFAFGT
jgi:hypothetical protein